MLSVVTARCPVGCHLTGSSTSELIVQQVEERVANKRVIVILDSEHARSHVLEEMRLYAPFVTIGSYLIVEDTNVNGHPVYPEFGAGPSEAVTAFLETRDDFEVDPSREKFLLTFNPRGYLKRIR